MSEPNGGEMFQAVKTDVVWDNNLYSIYDAKALLTPSAYMGIWSNLFDEGDVGSQLWLLLPQRANTQEVVEAMRGVETWGEVVGLSGHLRSCYAMGPKRLAEKLNIRLGIPKRHRRGKRHKMRSSSLYDVSEEVMDGR